MLARSVPAGHGGGDGRRRGGEGGPRRASVKLPANPLVHEIFTWVWLADLSARAGARVTLADVPAAVWDDVARAGVDAVWLMGVWERSPAGAAIARRHPAMAAAQRAALPDVTDEDVVGSAYCIRDYRVDDAPRRRRRPGRRPCRPGGARGRARARLRPQPRRPRPPLGHGAPGVLRPRHGRGPGRDPDSYLAAGDAVIARGRDPYFPAWPEVLQLDTSLPATWAAAAAVVDLDRRTLRRRALRHGDADARRRVRPHVGRSSRRRPVTRRRPGLLADGHRGGAVAPPGPGVLGRGLLGPRAGARRAGLRCVLRQAPVRPARRARAGGLDPRPPRGRSRLPGAHRALRREPRRAAARGRAAATGGDGGCGRRPHAARRRPGARGPVGRSTGPCAGDARSASGRAARRRAPGVVRGGARRPGERPPSRSVVARRRRRLARQPLVRAPRRLAVDVRVAGRGPPTSSSSTSPTSAPTGSSACGPCRPARSS